VIVAQATETAGAAAIVTALGGVAVSLTTVWMNSRKQGAARAESEARLSAEVEILRGEVARLRRELEQAAAARIERDRLMDLCQAYGGRRLRQRLIDVDLRK
jgi:hypothetical protein